MITNKIYANFAKSYGKSSLQSFNGTKPKKTNQPSNQGNNNKRNKAHQKFQEIAIPLLAILSGFSMEKASEIATIQETNRMDTIEIQVAASKNLAIVEIANVLTNSDKPIMISKSIDPTDPEQTPMSIEEIIKRIYDKNKDPKIYDLWRFTKEEKIKLNLFIKKYFNEKQDSLEKRFLVEDLVNNYLNADPNDTKFTEIANKIIEILKECTENINYTLLKQKPEN